MLEMTLGAVKNSVNFVHMSVSVTFLFRSDPITDRALLCLEVGSWEIYDIIFADSLAQCSRTLFHIQKQTVCT